MRSLKWVPEAARLLRPGGELVFLRNATLAVLCYTGRLGEPDAPAAPARSVPARLGGRRIDRVPDVPRRVGTGVAGQRLRGPRVGGALRARRRDGSRVLPLDPEWARTGPGKRSGRPASAGERSAGTADHPRLTLAAAARDPRAARHPVRRRVAEVRRAGDDPLELAAGKARSVEGGDQPVLGVDTEVVVDGEALGKPGGAAEAEAMLERLSGRTHEVVSGLCLRTRAWEELHSETTRVTFRPLTARDLAHYIGSGEWQDRAGGYAIQGLGGSLVERHRRRLLERRRPASGAPGPPPRRALPGNVRLRLSPAMSRGLSPGHVRRGHVFARHRRTPRRRFGPCRHFGRTAEAPRRPRRGRVPHVLSGRGSSTTAIRPGVADPARTGFSGM